jgi:type I restriction enzyme, S subunit
MSSSESRPLGQLVELRRGSTYKSALLHKEGPVLLGLSSIAPNGGFRRDALKSYGGESPETIILKPGELYVSLKDVTQSGDLLGAVARVPPEISAGRLTQDTVRLIFRDSCSDHAEYVYWLLRSPQYREYCRVHAIGVTTLALPKEDFLAFPVPPKTSSRTAIVDALRALDDKMEHNHRLCCLLEEIGRLEFRRATQTRDKRPMNELFEVNPRRSLPKSILAPYLEMANMPTVGHYPEGWTQRQPGSGARFTNGDTLVARITPCLENGKVAFVDFLDASGVGWGSTEYIVLRPKPPLPVEFAYFVARDNDFRDFAVRHMSGTSGRQRVSAQAIGNYMVAVPDNARLASLSQTLQTCLRTVRALRRESQTLSAIRDALLPKLVSGQIRVPESYQL